MVDDLVKHQHGWAVIHRKLPVEEIYAGFLTHLGHPVRKRRVDEDEVRAYSKWLKDNGEPVFSTIIEGMRERGKTPHAIRITMMFLIANLEWLKEKEALEGRNRSIDDGSVGEAPIAQLVEQQTFNLWVPSSSLGGRTKRP